MISKRGNEPPINYDTWLGYLNCWISSKISSTNSLTPCVWFDGPYSNAALHTSCFMYIPFAVTELPSHYRERRFPPRHFTTLFEQRSGDHLVFFRQFFFFFFLEMLMQPLWKQAHACDCNVAFSHFLFQMKQKSSFKTLKAMGDCQRKRWPLITWKATLIVKPDTNF